MKENQPLERIIQSQNDGWETGNPGNSPDC